MSPLLLAQIMMTFIGLIPALVALQLWREFARVPRWAAAARRSGLGYGIVLSGLSLGMMAHPWVFPPG